MNKYNFKELTCSVVGFSDAQLWYEIREASRGNSYAWNACEVLESREVTFRRRETPCRCGAKDYMVYKDGSIACPNVNAHRERGNLLD